MNIADGSLFVNNDGRTIKVSKIYGTKPKDSVEFHIDGSKSKTIHTYEVFKKMLESAGYKDITQTFSGFSVFKDNDLKKSAIGYTITSPDGIYTAEIIKKDFKGIHIKFSRQSSKNSTTYIYDEKDFDITWIFTPELVTELNSKYDDINVFEVIGEYKTMQTSGGYMHKDAKFTVLGKIINQELLDKINKAYSDVEIYSIKRLTSVNIQ
jgi:ABC-type transport system substrate-binding protein